MKTHVPGDKGNVVSVGRPGSLGVDPDGKPYTGPLGMNPLPGNWTYVGGVRPDSDAPEDVEAAAKWLHQRIMDAMEKAREHQERPPPPDETTSYWLS